MVVNHELFWSDEILIIAANGKFACLFVPLPLVDAETLGNLPLFPWLMQA